MPNDIAPSHPALQAPTMPLDRMAMLCFESANDQGLHPQFRAMNTRLWVLTGHLRVAVARQIALAAQVRQLPAPDSDLAGKAKALDSELAGFVQLFGPEIAQKLNKGTAPTASALPAVAPADAPATLPALPSDAPAAPPPNPEASIVQTALAGKAEDLAGAKIVQVVKPKGGKR